jgi:hypothetical protein
MKKLHGTRGILPVALALLVPGVWAAPLHAEETAATAPKTDPYVELYAAIDTVIGSEQAFDRYFRFAMTQFRQSPVAQKIARSEPKAVDAIIAAMRPWLKRQSDRMDAQSKPRYIALMREQLSPEDAGKLAAYCRTERGRAFLVKQFDPERLFAEFSGEAAGTTPKPLGKPTAFLKPAEGYTPPAPKPVAGPKPVAEAPDPAVAAVLEDPALQARLTGFFAAFKDLMFELGSEPADKDIEEGMYRDMDYAASGYGWRLYDRPL